MDMTVENIVQELKLQVLAGNKHLAKKITGGYSSDLLSDVIGNAKEGQVWITMQAHKNIIAVAALKDLAAIVIVNGLKTDKETLETADKEGIPVLTTSVTAFEIAGKLYQLISKK